MEDVQETSRLFLARRGNRFVERPKRLGHFAARRKTILILDPRVFRCERRDRPGKPRPPVHGRGPIGRGPRLLRVPNRHGEHPQPDVQHVDRLLY